MPLYVDHPVWPWRGRTWAHLISDHSYDELHEAARSLAIPERAFDGDHYDIPGERWHEVVAFGAHPVGSREIVRLLRQSGLRMPKHQRPGGVFS